MNPITSTSPAFTSAFSGLINQIKTGDGSSIANSASQATRNAIAGLVETALLRAVNGSSALRAAMEDFAATIDATEYNPLTFQPLLSDIAGVFIPAGQTLPNSFFVPDAQNQQIVIGSTLALNENILRAFYTRLEIEDEKGVSNCLDQCNGNWLTRKGQECG
jgi:hypothetical protein